MFFQESCQYSYNRFVSQRFHYPKDMITHNIFLIYTTHIYIHMHIYICIYVYIQICVYVNTHIYVYVYTHICIYIQIQIYIHIYICIVYIYKMQMGLHFVDKNFVFPSKSPIFIFHWQDTVCLRNWKKIHLGIVGRF